uniref:Fibrinolytic protease (Fragments) n=1 Tax=Euphausia superba TaxID=6819 RepID=FIBS_EUPSU|nr:RecName: Full=Fibrinolytic protease [Euphausia superba]
IVGGNEVTPHAYPWQVGLFIDDMYFCGGSISVTLTGWGKP